MQLSDWILAIICVEAITEILVQSDLFFEVRDWIGRKSNKLATLVTCGYCTSVWVAAIIIGGIIAEWYIIGIAIKIFALHRLSNIFHALIKRRLDGEPIQFVIIKDEVSGN